MVFWRDIGESEDGLGSNGSCSSPPNNDHNDETSEPHPSFTFLKIAEVFAVAATCRVTVCNLRPGFSRKADFLRDSATDRNPLNPKYSASSETRAPPTKSHAEVSLPPSLRKLEEARQADMRSGGASFKKLLARA